MFEAQSQNEKALAEDDSFLIFFIRRTAGDPEIYSYKMNRFTALLTSSDFFLIEKSLLTQRWPLNNEKFKLLILFGNTQLKSFL